MGHLWRLLLAGRWGGLTAVVTGPLAGMER